MKILASHILVEKLEQAEAIKSNLDAGLDFAQAAITASKCPSKDMGGSLGFFGRGQMVKEFEDAAFAAEVGTVTGPVKTQYGYHLIKRLY